jgi:hypothetical protein
MIKTGSRVENVRFEDAGLETWKVNFRQNGLEGQTIHISEVKPLAHAL